MAVVIDVNRSNADKLWPRILFAIQSASFIAIDLEMTGLGTRGKKRAKNMAERYPTLRAAAQTRSLLSFGIACFCANSDNASSWTVQTFDVALFCQREYVVEPQTLTFLRQHAFDFNQQVTAGLPYTPPTKDELLSTTLSADEEGTATMSSPCTRCNPAELFRAIIAANVPVVVHNGLSDLLFLYESFWAPLPSKWEFFANNAAQLFSNVIDTKYLCEFVAHDEASFLEYVFRKQYRRSNDAGDESKRMSIQSATYVKFLPKTNIVQVAFPAMNGSFDQRKETKTCHKYSRFGFCNNDGCQLSHDLDLILDRNLAKPTAKRSKAVSSDETDSNTTRDSSLRTKPGTTSSDKSGVDKRAAVEGHRAGYDAFMTGYVYASYVRDHPDIPTSYTSRLYVMGAQRNSLLLKKSAFTQYTATHQAAWKRLQSDA
eukprot:TRINITY_DN9498_c0_g1_i1.p2 TRINITY_DN9498_c0_g1~~TRINITY_DN9498_c0_g1_i1.p2  ORF type:complete len:429 (+),score=102.28 TRINITY_DN9498_c0_g1_i1:3-1289(+)